MSQKIPSLEGLVLDLSNLRRNRYVCSNKYRPPRSRKHEVIEPIDLANLVIRRRQLYGTQHHPALLKPLSESDQPTQALSQPVKPRASRDPARPRPRYYEPTPAEIEAMKTKLRERHRSEMLKPSRPGGHS